MSCLGFTNYYAIGTKKYELVLIFIELRLHSLSKIYSRNILRLDDGLYRHYILDENDNEVIIGIALKTVGDLKTIHSITCHELKYWDKDYSQTAQ